MKPEDLAKDFHQTYERLAPLFGYETRPESAKPWDEVPAQNRNLMIAVCADIIKRYPKLREAKPEGESVAIFEAYSQSYFLAHGTEPLDNPAVRRMLIQLSKKVGGSEAAKDVLHFYVNHRDAYYVKCKHPVELCLRDAQKLVTEMRTGRVTNIAQAKQTERGAGNASSIRRALERKHGQKES